MHYVKQNKENTKGKKYQREKQYYCDLYNMA